MEKLDSRTFRKIEKVKGWNYAVGYSYGYLGMSNGGMSPDGQAGFQHGYAAFKAGYAARMLNGASRRAMRGSVYDRDAARNWIESARRMRLYGRPC